MRKYICVLIDQTPSLTPFHETVARSLRKQPDAGRVDVVKFDPLRVEELKKYDLVFNLVDWPEDNRAYDWTVPALLDLRGIKFTGSDHVAMLLCRDKEKVKQIVKTRYLKHHGPESYSYERATEALIRHPLIVKPRYGEGSDGITEKSVVRTVVQLNRELAYIEKEYGPALIEQFIPGNDVTVMVFQRIGCALPVACIPIVQSMGTFLKIDTYNIKQFDHARKAAKVRWKQYPWPDLQNFCEDLFNSLQLSGYARFDFRARHTEDGPQFYFLEVTPHPSLNRHMCFPGFDYDTVLRQIVEHALATS